MLLAADRELESLRENIGDETAYKIALLSALGYRLEIIKSEEAYELLLTERASNKLIKKTLIEGSSISLAVDSLVSDYSGR